MGRKSKQLPTIEHCHAISISLLKRGGFLQAGAARCGTIVFEAGGKTTGQLSFIINTCTASPYLHLSYFMPDSSGERVQLDFKIYLEAVTSNLGKGVRYYFICPETGRRCTTLYRPWGTRFLHRTAYEGFYYDSQVLAKSAREVLFVLYERQADDLLSSRKRIKWRYRGKPTRLQRRLERLDQKSQKSFRNFESIRSI